MPRHGLSDAGRRMFKHGIGHSHRPLLEAAYQADSHNRPSQPSFWPARPYLDNGISNYPTPYSNQLALISQFKTLQQSNSN